MNVVLYYFKKKLLNGANDIEGYWGNFDFKKDKISDFKLMFILPNGKCLFMPYSPNDIGRREGEYEHLIYMLNAIDMILEEFQIDKKNLLMNG